MTRDIEDDIFGGEYPDDKTIIDEVEERGALRERERIIALIESKDEWHYAFSDVSDVIALIKGESNWADSVQEMKKDWPE
jgi:hypothetical protein